MRSRTPDGHHSIHGLPLYHLLRIYRHQIPEQHTRRSRKTLMQTDRRKLHRQSARQMDTPLHRLQQLRRIGMTGIKAREGVYHSDDREGKRGFRVAERFDESFSEEEREIGVAILGEGLTEAGC